MGLCLGPGTTPEGSWEHGQLALLGRFRLPSQDSPNLGTTPRDPGTAPRPPALLSPHWAHLTIQNGGPQSRCPLKGPDGHQGACPQPSRPRAMKGSPQVGQVAALGSDAVPPEAAGPCEAPRPQAPSESTAVGLRALTCSLHWHRFRLWPCWCPAHPGARPDSGPGADVKARPGSRHSTRHGRLCDRFSFLF